MKTIIYGNGAMAKVLYSYARHSMDIVGFTVDDACIADGENEYLSLPLVRFSHAEQVFEPSQHQIIIAMGYLEMNDLRERKYQEAKQKGYSFTSYIHPGFILHDGVTVGENSIILDYVSVHPGSKIGRGCFISSNVNIGHDCLIADNNWINSGVAIAGGCEVGTGCFFGVNSALTHGLKVGDKNFIAANTLLTKSSEDEQVYISEAGQLFKLKSKSFIKFSKALSS